MTTLQRTRIGFVSPTGSQSSHFDSFRAIIPKEVELDIEGIGLRMQTLYDLKGKLDVFLEKAKELVAERKWEGVIVSGAPVEVLNPGLAQRLQQEVPVPTTTALGACVAALRAYKAQRVLLLTPFDETLNRMVREHLAKEGVRAVSPPPTVAIYTDALKLTPQQVYELTSKALASTLGVQAIYFQGAILDPIKMMDRMESELKITVIASNPAMLWRILSRLGKRLRLPGPGRLLREWPSLPA